MMEWILILFSHWLPGKSDFNGLFSESKACGIWGPASFLLNFSNVSTTSAVL